MFIAPEDLPLPYEYRFFELDGLIQSPPADIAQRTVVFLDCGNIDRNSASVLQQGRHLLNIDHHHDNTRFGTLDHVVPDASCTAEIVWDLMHGLGVRPTRGGGAGAVCGADHRHGAVHVREHRSARARDGGRADRSRRGRAGRLPATVRGDARGEARTARARARSDAALRLRRADAGGAERRGLPRGEAQDSYSEGIIDHLRAVQGTKVAVLVRELSSGERTGQRKVSLRATDDDVDVSRIAREQGGGGHRRAAGFSTTLEVEPLIEFLRCAIAAQLHANSNGPAAADPGLSRPDA